MSVWGNLLFMSVEETRGKIDCTLTPPATATTRFRGVRIFDISNIEAPVQIAAVQTCRGSHTHTLVTDPDDAANIYVYVSGTAGIRSAAEMAGCNSGSSLTDPTTANFRIDVIKVPLAAPQTAAIVSNPRLFSKCGSSACESQFATTGAASGPALRHPRHPQLAQHVGRAAALPGRRPACPRRPERLAEQRLPRHHRLSRDRARGGRLPG